MGTGYRIAWTALGGALAAAAARAQEERSDDAVQAQGLAGEVEFRESFEEGRAGEAAAGGSNAEAGAAESAAGEDPAGAATDAPLPAFEPPPVEPTHARSAVTARRRDPSVVGGWVRSWTGSGGVTVEEIVLWSNGEWRRRTAVVSPATGLLGEPAEEIGTWYTEEGTLVLLEHGSAPSEALRAAYELSDRADSLTLRRGEGGVPIEYFRYR